MAKPWSKEEDKLFHELFTEFGNSYTKYTDRLPGRTYNSIATHAYVTGLTVKRWKPEEVEILEDLAGAPVRIIRHKLLMHGFTRNCRAISKKLSKMGAEAENTDWFTSRGLALRIGCSQRVVQKWLTRGILKGRRDERDHQEQPRWKIPRSAVRAFMCHHVTEWSQFKPDAWFLVEILANKSSFCDYSIHQDER